MEPARDTDTTNLPWYKKFQGWICTKVARLQRRYAFHCLGVEWVPHYMDMHFPRIDTEEGRRLVSLEEEHDRLVKFLDDMRSVQEYDMRNAPNAVYYRDYPIE